MFEGTDFGQRLDLLKRSLAVATLRRDVISNNLANAGVPNFKRSEVNFETSLKRALESEQEKPVLEMTRTDARHFSNYNPVDYRSVEPRRVLDYLTASKNNGNNVDAEEEAMAAFKNQALYTLEAQSAQYEFSQINMLLR